tara:strand:- start:416 stop:880 length:465 start_codon:yes stop_codon:yes gene_type:complete
MYREIKTKCLALFLGLTIIFMPTSVLAQETGKITNLEKGEEAPFQGVLMDTATAGRLLAEKEYEQIECNLRIEYELQKIKAKYALEIGIIENRATLLEEQNTSILSIKNTEIERLQKLALKNPNDNANWWFTGGVVAGIVTSIAIFYAAVETSK